MGCRFASLKFHAYAKGDGGQAAELPVLNVPSAPKEEVGWRVASFKFPTDNKGEGTGLSYQPVQMWGGIYECPKILEL